MIVFGRAKVKARARHFDGALRRRVGGAGRKAEGVSVRRASMRRVRRAASLPTGPDRMPRRGRNAVSMRSGWCGAATYGDMPAIVPAARRFVDTSIRRPVGPSARRKRGDRVGIGSRARTARGRSRACPALARAGGAGCGGTFRGVHTNARCRAKGRRRPARRRDARARGVRYSVVRTCQSSGNSTTSSILRRYGAPLVPPVPCLKPMMRSTVVTWRKRHWRNASSRSTSSSAIS